MRDSRLNTYDSSDQLNINSADVMKCTYFKRGYLQCSNKPYSYRSSETVSESQGNRAHAVTVPKYIIIAIN